MQQEKGHMIEEVLVSLQKSRMVLQKKELSSSRLQWQAFLNDPQREKGGWIHKWTKEVYVGQGAAGYLTMQEQLAAHQKMWSEVWRETDQQVHLTWPATQMEPEITIEQILKASASFKGSTSTPDGMHPRWFGCLDTPALQALIRLMTLFELSGLTPFSSLIRMLPKPAGGWRPIALLAALAFDSAGVTPLLQLLLLPLLLLLLVFMLLLPIVARRDKTPAQLLLLRHRGATPALLSFHGRGATPAVHKQMHHGQAGATSDHGCCCYRCC